jgi:glycogen(starch) synthase
VYVAGEERRPDLLGETRAPAPQNVKPLGSLQPEALADWFARASIYALPARYEPFGLSALEAALSGCALVLGDIDSLREIWAGAAVFVPPDDRDALARAIHDLIDEPDMRRRAAHLAHERALQFTPQRMARSYMIAYRHVLRAAHATESRVPALWPMADAQPLPG